MSVYTQPQSATITTASPVTWSNGTLFSGYIQIGAALPTDAEGAQYPSVNLSGTSQELPKWTVIPVVQGQVDSNTAVFFSNSLEPPNCRYAVYWFDNSHPWKLVYPFPSGTLPTLISITTNPYVLTVPTLTVPGVPTSDLTPAPQDPSSTPTASGGTYAIPVEYTLTGTADGVNAVFTVPVVPLIFTAIFIDGQKQDTSTYIRNAATVTFTTPPTSGASVTGLVI